MNPRKHSWLHRACSYLQRAETTDHRTTRPLPVVRGAARTCAQAALRARVQAEPAVSAASPVQVAGVAQHRHQEIWRWQSRIWFRYSLHRAQQAPVVRAVLLRQQAQAAQRVPWPVQAE
jgi:hypothetical protein